MQFDSSNKTAFTPQAAITLLLQDDQLSRKDVVGLSAISTTEQPKMDKSHSSPSKKQQSVKSFFLPKPKAAATLSSRQSSASGGSSSSLMQQQQQKEHNEEGRFQFFRFPNMDILQTYVPNNGTKPESFEKRRKWDKDILEFLTSRQAILQAAATASTSTCASISSNDKDKGNSLKDQPLLWLGDMNVAKDYRDGTHWKRGMQGDDSSSSSSSHIYEWWTDESKCVASGARSPANSPPKSNDDIGMPSFTPAERRRFEQILSSGNLVDVWRVLRQQQHPNGGATSTSTSAASGDSQNTFSSEWDKPNWTWRGHLGKNGSHSKYQGKGQRVDYFLLSPSNLLSSVESCEILGYGERRDGLFCGSDHCASLLKLKKEL
jgi:exonuclease III